MLLNKLLNNGGEFELRLGSQIDVDGILHRSFNSECRELVPSALASKVVRRISVRAATSGGTRPSSRYRPDLAPDLRIVS